MTSNIRLSIHPLIQIHMWHSISVPCRTHKRLTGFSLSQLLHMFLGTNCAFVTSCRRPRENCRGAAQRKVPPPFPYRPYGLPHLPPHLVCSHTLLSLLPISRSPRHWNSHGESTLYSHFTPFTLFTLHPSVSPYYVISDIILEYLHKFFKSAGDHGYVVIMYINIVYLMHLSHDGKWIESIFLILTVWNTSRSHYNHMHWKKLKRKRKKKNQEITNKK